MRKKIVRVCKLQFLAGEAKPGPALASIGINIPQFCEEFNEVTKEHIGDLIPVLIIVYEDKCFDFEVSFHKSLLNEQD